MQHNQEFAVNTPLRSSQAFITAENLRFAVYTFILTLLAHAMAYLAHEYSHSVLAWALGWMHAPFEIDYGPSTVYNALLLNGVSDNVAYDPIFASGHGASAALIALSGAFLGNGALYFASYSLASSRFIHTRRHLLALVYWFSLMSAANVWSYVPIRAITTHADIALAAQGLHISSWALFPFLMIPSAYIAYHFFAKMFPRVYATIAAGSAGNLALLIAVTAYWYFLFFGNDGLRGDYGLVSQILSFASCYLLFPLCVVYLSARYAGTARLAGNS